MHTSREATEAGARSEKEIMDEHILTIAERLALFSHRLIRYRQRTNESEEELQKVIQAQLSMEWSSLRQSVNWLITGDNRD